MNCPVESKRLVLSEDEFSAKLNKILLSSDPMNHVNLPVFVTSHVKFTSFPTQANLPPKLDVNTIGMRQDTLYHDYQKEQGAFS